MSSLTHHVCFRAVVFLLLAAVLLVILLPGTTVLAQEDDDQGGGAEPESTAPWTVLDLFKLAITIVLFFCWAAAVHWVDTDTKQQELLSVPHFVWNGVIFGSGLVALLMIWLIPPFLVSFPLALLIFLGPAIYYVTVRNAMMPDEKKVLTGEHLSDVWARMLGKVGVRVKTHEEAAADKQGYVPLTFISAAGAGAASSEEATPQSAEGYPAAKELVYTALTQRATHLLLESKGETTAIRYRIDGIACAAEPVPREVGDAIIHVIKVLSGLDASEHRRPQEGRFKGQLEGRELEFLIATAGSVKGERLVFKILDGEADLIPLAATGLSPAMQKRIGSILAEPQGMMLISGPSGSGKTTTLYACVRSMDAFTRNICTIEQATDYELPTVTQQIIGKAPIIDTLNRTLRQDADVIMIGEIRDEETAKAAVRAAAGNTMMLAGVTAKDCFSCVRRMLELKVGAKQLAAVLAGALSQRLVRVLCNNCKEPYRPKPEFLKKANLPAKKVDVFHRPPTPDPEGKEPPCEVCGANGYYGRTGIFEFMPMTDAIRDAIAAGAEAAQFKVAARKAGMLYLQEEGLKQVIRGTTSIKELLRVIK